MKTHGFELMEEMFLKKGVRRISVDDVLLTLLVMIDQVTTPILHTRRKTASDSPLLDLTP
jgi:hypothetical protein